MSKTPIGPSKQNNEDSIKTMMNDLFADFDDGLPQREDLATGGGVATGLCAGASGKFAAGRGADHASFAFSANEHARRLSDVGSDE